MEKECIICGEMKSLSDYYVHKRMKDGHLNKCKSCCKEQAMNRHYTLSENDEWVEKERKRSRDKYHRLGYRERQYELNKKSPYKNALYKRLHHKLSLGKGLNVHHWNYREMEDVIILCAKQHRRAHTFIELDNDLLLFRIKGTDVVLDTKDKHVDFLISKGIEISQHIGR